MAGLIAIPSAGAATVTLGKIGPAGLAVGCGGCSAFQALSDPASPSYTVPQGGPWTLVSWSSRGGSVPTSTARLQVFRPIGNAGTYQLVAESADADFGPIAAPVIPVNIPVQQGDQLGIRTGAGDMVRSYPSASGTDIVAFVMAGGGSAVGQTMGVGGTYMLGHSPSEVINVAATLTAPDPVAPAPKKKKCRKGFRRKTVKTKSGKKRKKCVRKKKRK